MHPAYSPLESEFESPQAESAYEVWLRVKVTKALIQADNPGTARYSTDEVRRRVYDVIEHRNTDRASQG